MNGDLFFEALGDPGRRPALRPRQARSSSARPMRGRWPSTTAEIAAIAANPEPPTFDNTIAAMERSGRALDRVGNVFHLLAGAHTNDALLEIEREISPKLARHWNAINTNAALFARIDTLMRDAGKLPLTTEQKRVIERYHTGFRRAGAALDAPAKKRLSEIIERLAALGTAFSQNVLADEQSFTLRLEDEAELAGLPGFMREAMKARGARARARRLCRDLVTVERRAVPAILQPPRFARKDLPRLRHARRQWRADRQQSQYRRNGAAARRARQAARLCRLRPLPARRRHGEDAGRGAQSPRNRMGAGARPRPRRSRRHAEADRRRRRQLQARRLGLALLRREASPEDLRFRRSRDQALSQSRSPDRSRLLHRAAPVRPELHAAHRRAGLASRCAGLGGQGQGRQRGRPVLRRLLRRARQSAAAPG